MSKFLAIALVTLVKFVQADYFAAVAEHVVYMGSEGDSPEALVNRNLEMYEHLTALAGKQQVHILVFPEFGITPTDKNERSNLYPFAERIPDVQLGKIITPCTDSAFQDRPILSRMSCAARDHSVQVVVNMIDWVDCSIQHDTNCPSDNHFQYNTDVVFDDKGRLVAKHHRHEWHGFDKSYDMPLIRTEVTYRSRYDVAFGLFLCADMRHEVPPRLIVARGVKHYVYVASEGHLGESVFIDPSSESQSMILPGNLGSGWINCATLPTKKYFVRQPGFEKESILVARVPAS